MDARDRFSHDPAGSLVRPYMLAGGRSRPGRRDLEMITLVVATTDRINEVIGPEHGDVVNLCQQPCSVAEISAWMNLPLIVVKIILSDLIERGYVVFRSSPTTSDTPSLQLLQAVLDGIRRL